MKRKKSYDKISISTPMCAHGHYGHLNNNHVFKFILDQKEAYEKINKIIDQKEFDYLLDDSKKFQEKINNNDIKYFKFIFNELKQYCDKIEKINKFHADEIYENTHANYVHFLNSFNQLSDYENTDFG